MGERSMKACLDEQLDVMREAARLHGASVCGFTLQDWYGDGADLNVFLNSADILGGDDNFETITKIAYAWGYIEGAADMADVTVSELLDDQGLTFDAPLAPTKRQKIRKVTR